jgi:hypothetical protein
LKARRLFYSAAYGPDVLGILFEAFDGAWERLAPTCGSDPQVIETTRSELASAILDLVRERPKSNSDELRDAALKRFSLARHRAG